MLTVPLAHRLTSKEGFIILLYNMFAHICYSSKINKLEFELNSLVLWFMVPFPSGLKWE